MSYRGNVPIESEVMRSINGFRLKDKALAPKSIVPPSLRMLVDPNSELLNIEAYLDTVFTYNESDDQNIDTSAVVPLSEVKQQHRDVSDALTSLILSIDAVHTAQLRNSEC